MWWWACLPPWRTSSQEERQHILSSTQSQAQLRLAFALLNAASLHLTGQSRTFFPTFILFSLFLGWFRPGALTNGYQASNQFNSRPDPDSTPPSLQQREDGRATFQQVIAASYMISVFLLPRSGAEMRPRRCRRRWDSSVSWARRPAVMRKPVLVLNFPVLTAAPHRLVPQYAAGELEYPSRQVNSPSSQLTGLKPPLKSRPIRKPPPIASRHFQFAALSIPPLGAPVWAMMR